MPVDSFKYLPRLIKIIYEDIEMEKELPIPWTPLKLPIRECRFGLLTTGGLYHTGFASPFNLEREKQEPTWGDPGYRVIPRSITQEEVGISHLHVNNEPVLEDFNILLPINRFQKLEENGRIGSLGDNHYSFMGYQGYPQDTASWRDIYAPEIAKRFLAEDVNCVVITPS